MNDATRTQQQQLCGDKYLLILSALIFMTLCSIYRVAHNDGSLQQFDMAHYILQQQYQLVLPSKQSILPQVQRPTGIKPLDCNSLLQSLENATLIQDPNHGKILCRRIVSYKNPFYTCLHEQSYDNVRYSIVKTGQYHKTALNKAFSEILSQQQNNETVRVLDVGGSIGWYANLAASMGHPVDVFEPHLPNGIRICQSMQMNSFEHDMNYYAVAVGNVDNVVLDLHLPNEDLQNPGMATLVENDLTLHWPESTPVQVVSLDQFAQDKGYIVEKTPILLKIDVEGYEDQVIEGAKGLLNSKLVSDIFIKTGQSLDGLEEMLSTLGRANYRVHATGSWMGPNKKFQSNNETPAQIHTWLVGTITKKEISHVWWKRKE